MGNEKNSSSIFAYPHLPRSPSVFPRLGLWRSLAMIIRAPLCKSALCELLSEKASSVCYALFSPDALQASNPLLFSSVEPEEKAEGCDIS